ncbi:uncharacterized protein LOC141590074 [Silene latifolia]|uniref:uncharacterized protein LOC141590074 n=1 Tax=Silene latifolia TaxID=37657 RepID=UPI003D7862D0
MIGKQEAENDAHVVTVRDQRVEQLTASDIHVVGEFNDVFPDEIPELPPKRDIDFNVELKSGTGTKEPVSVLRPYNLSEVMESILEEESDEDWEEVPGRSSGQISESPSSTRVSGLQLTDSDVKDELEYWSTTVYCYVLGANPPFKVLDGFVKRIWGYTEIEKISFHSNGIFLVRFKTEAMKMRVLQAGPVFFDNKPVVVKEWLPESKLIREAVDMVPIWIRFYGLPLKFWRNALKKIASLVGNPIRCDSNTQLKTFLGYARIMVEVKVGDDLPEVIEFMDELDVKHRQIVHYEWRPTICTECKGMGHFSRDCRSKDKQPKGPVRGRKTWVPKKTTVPIPQPAAAVQAIVPAAAGSGAVPEQSRVKMTRSGEGPAEGVGAFVTPMPFSFHPSFSPSRIITQLTRQGGISVSSVRRTFLEVLERSIQVREVSESEVVDGLPLLENGFICHEGGRIWIVWDAMNYKVEVISNEAQVIHTRVTFLPTGVHWWLSMVYGFNRIAERIPLWESLSNMSAIVDGLWVVMGDFNNVLAMNERIGSEVTNAELRGFQTCIAACDLMDIPAHGAFFTWNNKHEVGDKVYSRINRVLVNDEWLSQFPETHTMFHSKGLFDHCPCTITLWPEVWDYQIEGNTMFQVVKKLKLLKQPLKALNAASFANIETAANVALIHLHDVQSQLHLDPSNVLLQQNEKVAAEAYRELDKARVSFLSQKAKTQWCSEGDENTSYFHSTLKARRFQNRVFCILYRHGVLQYNNAGIEKAFEDYYKSLLGTSKWVGNVHIPTVRHGVTVSETQAAELIRDVTNAEIYEALCSIPPNKSPGPDGYTSQFYKDAYSIVGKDIIKAVKEFFITGELLKQVNSTTLTLIPKKERPLSVADFRPIACCNVLYKIISKVICNRMANVLPEIISPNQSAFIKGREIVDNILICQDLVRLYNRKSCSPRCIMKMDLKKAYDSIEWQFIEQMLLALKFPAKMVQWIMKCVSSPWFTLSLNGSTFGYFQGKRGIRQSDPMSLLVFTICMEYLSRILRVVTEQLEFNYHSLCRTLKLSHLCFADDLIMFCRGDRVSIKVLLRAFATFSSVSGLEMNCDKSEIYFNGIPQGEIDYILSISGFKEGSFPFRYLGIPISYKRMAIGDCTRLVEKVVSKLRGWGAKKLSYSGRLVLIQSVLSQLHVYWARIFVIPITVLDRVTAICRNYLWSSSDQYGKAPSVAWDALRPKKFGGLGIVNCRLWNQALIGKYTWWLACKSDHLWIKWVDHVYMKGRNWQDYVPSLQLSWTWRKICAVKDIFKPGYNLNQWCDGKYTVVAGYRWLNVPKHSFIAWLFAKERLLTKDRLRAFGLPIDGVCDLCALYTENHHHLFYQCEFSIRCWDILRHWFSVSLPTQDILQWCVKWRFRSLLKKHLVFAAVVAVLYNIWRVRNLCRLDMVLHSPIQDEEEDMDEPDFSLSRNDPPELEIEDKEIEGTNQCNEFKVIPDSTITPRLDSGGMSLNSEPNEIGSSSNAEEPSTSTKWKYKSSHPMESILGNIKKGCSLDRKSTSCVATFVRPYIITWGSKKHNSIALSTAEAENIAAGLTISFLTYTF